MTIRLCTEEAFYQRSGIYCTGGGRISLYSEPQIIDEIKKTEEPWTDETISFGADSGAYTVQTNASDGYRVDAAAANFSKTVAANYYGTSDRIYGYIYGGSGGSFQNIGAIENSSGVWQGAVPFITGVPTSIPNNFFARAFTRFVLENKVQQIADVVSPGGSGNPYAGLSDVEQCCLGRQS
ncbi:hypothetical protein ABLO26_02285 [Neobacillus sp. 179-J 1A1 HS]|uniref:hypothetical protein n=1 Tax=Neobacillus driksii TaxID=3035913 RepID=UPI0035BBF130